MENVDEIIDGWRYIVKHSKHKTYEFDIIPPDDKIKQKPLTLFKYYSLNEYSVKAIENSYLYASHPLELNDIWDCNPNLIDIKEFVKNESNFNDFCSKYLTEYLEKGIDISNNEYFIVKEFICHLSFNVFGILSFTENPKNILMWSYYSQNSGFCVEFDYEKFDFIYYGPFQIKYTEQFQPLKIHIPNLFLNLLYTSFQKFKDWEHESEWRMLASQPSENQMESPNYKSTEKNKFENRQFHYSFSNTIKRIIIGSHFFDNLNNDFQKIDETKKVVILNTSENFESLNKLKMQLVKFIEDKKIKTFFAVPSLNVGPGYDKLQFEEQEIRLSVYNEKKYSILVEIL